MKVILTGGGTAGHINPAIAIAKNIKIKYENAEILFVGTRKGMESDLVPKEGFKIKYIHARGFERKFTLNNLKTATEAIKGIYEANKIIKEFKPDIVVGTGGYVCGPVTLCAALKGIPTVIHEQNVFPGVTIKILSRFATVTALSFEESKKYIKTNKKVVITGNPIRENILNTDYKAAREKLNISPEKTFVLAFGGSLGAEKINKSFVEYINYIIDDLRIYLILGTGKGQYDIVIDELDIMGISIDKCKNINVIPYIYNMDEMLSAADIVVSRAGAITLSEITALGKPSILIPSPYVADNHQMYNAKALEKEGAAFLLDEKELNGKIIFEQINKLTQNKSILEKMRKNSKSLGKPQACEKLTKIIIDIIEISN